MSRVRSTQLLVVFVCAYAVVAAHAEEPMYRVVDIGSDQVIAHAINNRDQVAGYVLPGGDWDLVYSFIWSPHEGMQTIGDHTAYDINDLGHVAGATSWYGAVVWDGSSWVDVDTQGAGAINNQDHVVGVICAQYVCAPRPYSAYVDYDIYTPGYSELPKPGARAAHALDINENSEIVGNGAIPDDGRGYYGLYYPTNDTYFFLQDDGAYSVWPHGLNDLGEIVGGLSASQSASLEAVYWSSPWATVERMGALGPGISRAWDINNRGEAVGESAGRAFRWTRGGGMVDLNTLIDSSLGITLENAVDINDRGSIVVRGKDVKGVQHAYLLLRVGGPRYVTAIGFSNHPNGDQDVTEFLGDETLYVFLKDVDIDSGEPLCSARLCVKGKRAEKPSKSLTVKIDLDRQPDGSFTGSVPLAGFAPGSARVTIDGKRRGTKWRLLRKTDIFITAP